MHLTHLAREWGTCGTCDTCDMCWRLSSTSSSESKNLQFRLNDPIATRLTNNWKMNVFRSGSRGVLNFKLFLTILSHLIIKKQLKDLHNWLTKFGFYTSIAKIENSIWTLIPTSFYMYFYLKNIRNLSTTIKKKKNFSILLNFFKKYKTNFLGFIPIFSNFQFSPNWAKNLKLMLHINYNICKQQHQRV